MQLYLKTHEAYRHPPTMYPFVTVEMWDELYRKCLIKSLWIKVRSKRRKKNKYPLSNWCFGLCPVWKKKYVLLTLKTCGLIIYFFPLHIYLISVVFIFVYFFNIAAKTKKAQSILLFAMNYGCRHRWRKMESAPISKTEVVCENIVSFYLYICI